MKKTEKILIICLVAIVLVTSSQVIHLKSKAINSEEIIVENMEITLSDETILGMADIIVKGNNIQKVDEINYQTDTINTKVSIYSVAVVDSYLGEYQVGDEILISYGGTVLPQDISNNGEKVMLLKKNILSYENRDVYSFVSISQGVYFEEEQMKNSLGKTFSIEEVQLRYENK